MQRMCWVKKTLTPSTTLSRKTLNKRLKVKKTGIAVDQFSLILKYKAKTLKLQRYPHKMDYN